MKGILKKTGGLMTAAVSIALACVITGAVMYAMGYDPLDAYYQLLFGSVGSASAFSESVVKMIPLVFTGLSFAVAKRSGLVNLGATGQLYMGALCATVVGVYVPGLPGTCHVLLALAAGWAGGALYGAVVAVLKSRFQANELITTIMLNEIAVELVNCLVDGPMKDLDAVTQFLQSRAVLESAVLPKLLAGTRLHAGVFAALLALVFYAAFMKRTRWGYELRVVGMNPTAARTAGMSVRRAQLLAMLLAGGFAGLAGGVEMLAIQKRLMQSFAGNLGFDGIAVALLGGGRSVGILLSALLFGMMSNGSNKMQMLSNVPSAVIYLMQGLIILFVVGRDLYTKHFWKERVLSGGRGGKEARA